MVRILYIICHTRRLWYGRCTIFAPPGPCGVDSAQYLQHLQPVAWIVAHICYTFPLCLLHTSIRLATEIHMIFATFVQHICYTCPSSSLRISIIFATRSLYICYTCPLNLLHTSVNMCYTWPLIMLYISMRLLQISIIFVTHFYYIYYSIRFAT